MSLNQKIERLEEIINSLPPDRQRKLTTQMLKTLFEESLYLFTKYCIGFKDINKNTHRDVIHALESDAKKILVVMPRGTLKSSLCTVAYSMWALVRNPNLRILIDSEVFMNSSKFLREIKNHLKQPLITSLWGEFEGPVWKDSEIIINQRSKIIKEASITCSGIGAEKTSAHYDVIIADDLNSPKNSNTQEGRQKVIDHYKMYTSLLEPDGRVLVVGTRYHSQDVLGNILDNEVNIENDHKTELK